MIHFDPFEYVGSLDFLTQYTILRHIPFKTIVTHLSYQSVSKRQNMNMFNVVFK